MRSLFKIIDHLWLSVGFGWGGLRSANDHALGRFTSFFFISGIHIRPFRRWNFFRKLGLINTILAWICLHYLSLASQISLFFPSLTRLGSIIILSLLNLKIVLLFDCTHSTLRNLTCHLISIGSPTATHDQIKCLLWLS